MFAVVHRIVSLRACVLSLPDFMAALAALSASFAVQCIRFIELFRFVNVIYRAVWVCNRSVFVTLVLLGVAVNTALYTNFTIDVIMLM